MDVPLTFHAIIIDEFVQKRVAMSSGSFDQPLLDLFTVRLYQREIDRRWLEHDLADDIVVPIEFLDASIVDAVPPVDTHLGVFVENMILGVESFDVILSRAVDQIAVLLLVGANQLFGRFEVVLGQVGKAFAGSIDDRLSEMRVESDGLVAMEEGLNRADACTIRSVDRMGDLLDDVTKHVDEFGHGRLEADATACRSIFIEHDVDFDDRKIIAIFRIEYAAPSVDASLEKIAQLECEGEGENGLRTNERT